jgi:hypothetical protein
MADRTPHTPDHPESRPRDNPSRASLRGGLTAPPDERDAEPATLPVAPEAVRALASPTLAALYASQGHGEMAAAIYAHLGQRASCPDGESPGSPEPAQPVPVILLQKLLALRQAARRRRGVPEGSAARVESEDTADGR